jgi:hypothetical protein
MWLWVVHACYQLPAVHNCVSELPAATGCGIRTFLPPPDYPCRLEALPVRKGKVQTVNILLDNPSDFRMK